jgi:uncharacterized membrane protein YoaK (UPF0700 family)
MDALSYLRAKAFTANMTGNTVLLGLAIAGPDRSRAFHSGLAICAFAAGVFLGGVLLLRIRQPDERGDLRIGAALETPLAVAFSILWAMFPSGGPGWIAPVLVVLAACMLGIQSVAVRRLKISGVVTTFITGTITTAIVSTLEREEPGAQKDKSARSSPVLLGGLFVLYIVAALTGALLTIAKSPLAALDALLPLLTVLFHVWIGGRVHS